ncbi:MAG: thioesterase family protein [Caulobacterales bacterium]
MAELTRFTEWTVGENEIDHLGHMNMNFYGLRAEEGCAEMMARIGLPQSVLDSSGLIVSAFDQHTLFRREQMEGARLSVSGEICAATPNAITLYEEIRNEDNGDVAGSFIFTTKLLDRATRAPRPFPEQVVETASARIIDVPARSQPRSVPTDAMKLNVTIADLARAKIEPHVMRKIEPEECDAEGYWAPSRPRAVKRDYPEVSQGVMDHVWRSIDGILWPALEQRVVAVTPARMGNTLLTYSAIFDLTHKILRWGSWVFEKETQRLVTTTQIANICFSPEDRRARDIPPEHGARLRAMAHPEFIGKS